MSLPVAGETGHVGEPYDEGWVHTPRLPVGARGREVGKDDHKGEQELHAEVGDARRLELVAGAVDAVDEGGPRDGAATLSADVQGSSEGRIHFKSHNKICLLAANTKRIYDRRTSQGHWMSALSQGFMANFFNRGFDRNQNISQI